MIKVLIVEDSPVIREFLTGILSSDPELYVVGSATNGEDAISAVQELKPDVITMDIHMPRVNGFDATRRIMETNPMPIVIVSGSSTAEEVSTTFHALKAGALAVVRRPFGIGHAEHEHSCAELIQTVKLMAEVKVVRRWQRATSPPKSHTMVPVVTAAREVRLVAIGSSTGGPLALQAILMRLPQEFPVPIVVVQHMSEGFIQGFAEWLGQSTPLQVHVATQGEFLLPGHVYLAPDGYHLEVRHDLRVLLRSDEPENGLRPSVARLFRSVAAAVGSRAVGILLTGMGKDGAAELKMLRDLGAVTIAQDKDSAVVWGMPAEADRLGAAQHQLPPEMIAQALAMLTRTPMT